MAQLYLCGGEIGSQNAAPAFVKAATAVASRQGRPVARLALLLQGSPNPYKYVPRYVEPWLAAGAGGYTLVAPSAAQQLDEEAALAAIQEADGIFVGGGNTAIYHRLYASGPIADAILARVRSGVPYGGVSAGMLIALSVCPLDPEETGEQDINLSTGLGLLSGVICEPHFSEQNRLAELLRYLALARISTGWGVDETACLLVEENRLTGMISGTAYQVQMTDFAQQTYQIKPLDCQ